MKDKARDALTEHRDKIEEGLDKAAEKAKEKGRRRALRQDRPGT
ncbi:MAG TPA: Rv0909 family putative TA system antitoxin [Acidimicrobiia bacterium]|nr:Rv0909 family putative TA system antitoxin [Acidimicrobiia bacterium]